ncbi:hypothetical protein CBR_g28807 [Chara braunii]|uniref:CCHC-type domain-containing protein n=1 Tax=Chara braunii TaxID=69332 RepID=A0A388L9V6_CHABU|nr:hypothetical protein CBR_g28807 [Chara braunii]|eukprot:GBG79091.1 hypothetical protein CBR_g28807 [Chara braunii]
MYLTTGPSSGNGGSFGGAGNYGGNNNNQQNLVGQSNPGGSGFGNAGGPNRVCYNCGKPGHFARDCWSGRGRQNQQIQQDPEIEEIKEQFRQARSERQEQEERRKAEEEKRAREEEEVWKNQDFARKMEELKLQLRIDLNEEWRTKNQAAEEAVRDTRREKTVSKARKGKRGRRKVRKTKRKVYFDTSEESTTETDTASSCTDTASDSEIRSKRTWSRKRGGKGRAKAGSRKGKEAAPMKEATPVVHEKGECSRKAPTEGRGSEHRDETAKGEDGRDKEAEPKTPLTNGYKGLSASCSQQGLIEYCISAHKIYSEKKAHTLRRICEKKGIKYTTKPEVVELLARQQVELAYDGFDTTKNADDTNGRGKAPETPRKETLKEKTVMETPTMRQPRIATEDLIGSKIGDRAIATFVKIRIRLVWSRNKIVGELLHNQKKYATEVERICNCTGSNLPKVEGHVKTRFANLKDIPSFVRNARNVTRSDGAVDIRTLEQAILAATKHLRGPEIPVVLPKDTVRKEARRSPAWTENEVHNWRRIFEGFVLTPIDCNQGDTAVICPVLYRHAFGKVFLWNENYEAVGDLNSEVELLRKGREDFTNLKLDKIGGWKPDGRLETAYVIPKHKDLDRWRPIAPAPSDPGALAQRRVARALHCLFVRLPVTNPFCLNSVAELGRRMEAAARRL